MKQVLQEISAEALRAARAGSGDEIRRVTNFVSRGLPKNDNPASVGQIGICGRLFLEIAADSSRIGGGIIERRSQNAER